MYKVVTLVGLSLISSAHAEHASHTIDIEEVEPENIIEEPTIRDPTLPTGYITVQTPIENIVTTQIIKEFKLNALWVSKNRREATINQQLVKEGDMIDNVLVVQISSQGVTLLDQGDTHLITFKEGFTKVMPENSPKESS